MNPCKQPCPKCGSDDIYRRHLMPGDDARQPGYRMETGRSTDYVDRSRSLEHKTLKECIMHKCRCCDYYWDGSTLDARNKRKKPVKKEVA